MSGQLLPHLLENWPAMIDATRGNVRPEVSADTDSYRDAVISYTRRLGPLATQDTQRIDKAIEELVQANTHSVNGSRRVLLIDGPSAMGKSQAVVAHAQRQAERVWTEFGRRVSNADLIPYIYVEVGATGRARALMQSVLEFVGLPIGPRETSEEMLARFRHLAPRLGVQVLIVDDAHMLRTESVESRQLTDFLKGMITSLPVSLVFVGAGLRDSALLRQSTRGGYSAAEQIARRANIVDLRPWPHSSVGDAWTRLVANLEAQLVIPHGTAKGALTSAAALKLLHTRSAGHPGLLIDWVKRASVEAITAGERLTLAALKGATPPRPMATT